MSDAEIKDSIINLLFTNPMATFNSRPVSEEIGLTEDNLMHYIGLIKGEKGNWIELFAGSAGNKNTISINYTYVDSIRTFIHAGGYVATKQMQERLLEEAQEERELYIENLRLSNAAAHDARLNADKAESRAKIATRAAWVATGAAVATVLLEVIKYLRT